jgi:hypothetical protein
MLLRFSRSVFQPHQPLQLHCQFTGFKLYRRIMINSFHMMSKLIQQLSVSASGGLHDSYPAVPNSS